MKSINLKIIVFALFISTVSFAQKYTKTDNSEVKKKWNETKFYSSKSFSENIAEVPNLSKLKKDLEFGSSLKAIEDEEMVTIFAMTNNGYEKLQAVQDSIFDISVTANRVALIKYHVVPGRVDSHSIKKAVKRSGSIAHFATLQGEKLGVKEENGQLFLVDSLGNTSLISATDFYHKNGYFHLVEGYVIPTME
jgi:uncharacterized surface protein with fasciclin (FAS1) repeats